MGSLARRNQNPVTRNGLLCELYETPGGPVDARAAQVGQTDSGLHCYALRQGDMWRTMAAQARQQFDRMQQVEIIANARKSPKA